MVRERACLALVLVKYKLVAPSGTSEDTNDTAPVYPFTDITASVLSTCCQTPSWNIAQSPTCQSLIPSKFVVPATLVI